MPITFSRRVRGRTSSVLVALLASAIGLAGLAVPASATASVATPRLSGVDRYATSAEVSEAAFPSGATRVIIASGRSFADGLAASALAGHLNAPLLLVPPSGPLPTAIKTELTRLGASQARVVGGVGAVSNAVANELQARGLTVTRHGGDDRYDTASRVARQIPGASIGSLGGLRTAIVVTGEDFPDALAASAPGFSGPHPILLTRRNTLPAATRSAISDRGIQRVVVMGGTGAVSNAVQQDIDDIAGVTSVVRVQGADRGQTARALADLLVTATPNGFGYARTGVVAVSGSDYPDALSAGPLAGRGAGPILFTSPTRTAAEAFLTAHRSTVATITVIGGIAAVPTAAVNALETAATLETNQTIAVSPAADRTWPAVAYSASNPATYVEYRASGIPSGVSKVAISLVDPAKVTTSSAGVVTFTKATGSPQRADLTNARVGDLRIRAVNGSATSSVTIGSASVSNGTVTFRVAVGGADRIGDALPVVYVANSGNLLVDASGAPTGHFGVGGAVRTVPQEAVASASVVTHTVWSVATDRFVANTSSTVGRLYHLRSGDIYQVGSAGGNTPAHRAAFMNALSTGDTVRLTYNQRVGAGGAFVANVFDIIDDVAEAPTQLSVATRDSDSNGSIDAVRLTFDAGRTGLQTTNGATVRRFPVTNGVVGTTPTDVAASWAYTSGTSGVIDLTNAQYPPPGNYVFQVRLKGAAGSSFGPYSDRSGTVNVTSAGLATAASAPVAVSITKAETSLPNQLSTGDAITVTFNEPVQLTAGTRFIEIQDAANRRARLQASNATFAVGGADSNVLTITVTGAPIQTNGVGPVALAAGTFIHSISDTFRDRQAGPLAWNPTPSNTLGAGGVPLGVFNVPGSTPTVPFTPTADTSGGSTGRITLNAVSDTVVGQPGAAVPGAVVYVSQVAGTGGTAADATTATRKQAVANAVGAFSIALTSATGATTMKVVQEIPRTATLWLTSAASAVIAAQPTLSATSALGDGDGEIADGDTIVLAFSGPMATAGLASFDVTVSDANPSVITITRAGTNEVVATITTTGRQYNDGPGTIEFFGSAGAWNPGNSVLTITLANRGGGTAATGLDPHTSTFAAGPALLDTNGVAIDTTAVIGASSRF